MKFYDKNNTPDTQQDESDGDGRKRKIGSQNLGTGRDGNASLLDQRTGVVGLNQSVVEVLHQMGWQKLLLALRGRSVGLNT